MAVRPTTEKRLLDAADELFFTRGIRATSVDDVLERAGVSPATLYRAYRSKEELVAAALRRRHDDWLATWDFAVDHAPDARARLLAVIDALDEFQQRPDGSRWCAFLGTAAEYDDAPAEIAAAVQLDTATLRARLTELARPLVGAGDAALAEQLLLVVSGHLAMRLRGSATPATREVAAAVVDAAASSAA